MGPSILERRKQHVQTLIDRARYLNGLEMLFATIYCDRFNGESLIPPDSKDKCEGTVWELLSNLSGVEFDIIVLRFGLLNNLITTVSEAGRLLELPTERVRQIEAEALRKLSTPSCRRQLNAFIQRPSQRELVLNVD